MEIEYFDDFIEKLVIQVSLHQNKKTERKFIFDALLMLHGDNQGLVHPVDVWDIEVSFEDALESLREFDFSVFSSPVEIEIEFEREELFQTKAKIKAAGFQVVIQRYDKDPFPSNPHGHICDQNLKIDLSNGYCYRNRDFVRKIKKKELLELREKASLSYKGNLPSLKI